MDQFLIGGNLFLLRNLKQIVVEIEYYTNSKSIGKPSIQVVKNPWNSCKL